MVLANQRTGSITDCVPLVLSVQGHDPSRVFKGMRMAGRMGGDRVTVQNLKVLKVVPEKNLLVVKGCVPGHKNAYVTIKRWQ